MSQLAEDCARFLREGQLAASVSHPHTVYTFGSEEITGVPVITMELVPGGTLKDSRRQRRSDTAGDRRIGGPRHHRGTGRGTGRRHPASRHQAVELLRR
jgi:serine/threonine protein kinase